MKGQWKPYSQVLGGTRKYIAGRQLDIEIPLHGGNVEYSGGYMEDVEAAAALCTLLNELENDRGKEMKAYYKTCGYCGAHLDPCERCGCTAVHGTGMPERGEVPDGMDGGGPAFRISYRDEKEDSLV